MRPKYNDEKSVADFDAVRLTVASEQEILSWSYGEVLKPETINYRTQKPERDGLFCERIFGPVKDINPHDAKLKGVRSREAAVDKNGELVTRASSRRERMGHIRLATPVAHIWFMRGTPSAMSLILNLTVKELERIAYFQSYAILAVDDEAVAECRNANEEQFNAARAAIKLRYDRAANGTGDEDNDVVSAQSLAKEMTAEIDNLTNEYNEKKAMLDSLVKGAIMNESVYRNLPEEYQDFIEVGMGGEALYRLLSEVDLDAMINDLTAQAQKKRGQVKQRLQKRIKMLEGMRAAGIKPESTCLTVLPVIPPDLRPMVQLTGGRFATSDLNDLYRRVINRNNRLKKLADLNAPEVITRNEKRMLQEAVDALIDNSAARGTRAAQATGGRRKLKSLSDMLKGKQGRFRQNLLGKRVDYSGRSVIVSGPDLDIDECGLPKTMALELFKPFVISKLLEWENANTIHTAQRMIEAGDPIIWDALEEVIKGKYVLLNRAPTLHRLSIQAFKPKLIEGYAIQVCPLVTSGFNADFDGDQMSVHLPLSDEAQAEARDLIAASNNLLKPSDGSPVLSIYQDIVLGCYYLTYNKQSAQLKDGEKPHAYASEAEAIMAHEAGEIEFQTPIIVRFRGAVRHTTLGRVLFNEVLPEKLPYVDEVLTKKVIGKVLARVFNNYGAEVTAKTANDIKSMALEYATRSAISTGMDDYFSLGNVADIAEEGEKKATQIAAQYDQGLITGAERHKLTVQAWRQVDAKVTQEVEDHLQKVDTAVSVLANSGARGSVDNIKQASAMIGVQVDASGREIELPVKNSYKHGMTPLEAFVVTRGSRYGAVSTALKTANSGYLTRRLVDVSQDVFTVPDEGAAKDPGFTIYRRETEDTMIKFADRLAGRYAAKDISTYVKAGELITNDIAAAIEADESIQSATIMSVLSTPELSGIPQKSYGIDMSTGFLIAAAEPIGVIAAQSVGEPGTQLTLDTKHSSGVGGDNISQGLPRVEELLEAHDPKGRAIVSDVDGTVTVEERGDNYIVTVTPLAGRTEEIAIAADQEVKVRDGAVVRTGDILAVNEVDSLPLVAPFDGVIAYTNGGITLTAEKQEPLQYKISNTRVLAVSDGDTVKAGDRITTGSIELRELMKYKGIAETERYIVNDVLRIYAAQGQDISPKHLEVIVRQMFSRVEVEDPGDSEFIAGAVISKARAVDVNKQLVAAGKKPIEFTQLILGITKVAVSSDSFLSGASFQDTTRVLIGAATAGRIDHLKGLKENVIIGRKIPVGTGALDEQDYAEPEQD